MSDSIFCSIRKKWVKALPEERVRQALIQEMTQRLGYPFNALILEKNLDQLPHLHLTTPPPKRRADLIVIGNAFHSEHPFYPLLLVECKAVPITEKTFRQVIGYNQFVGAPFIAVVNETKSFFGMIQKESGQFEFKEGFFSYEMLLKYLR